MRIHCCVLNDALEGVNGYIDQEESKQNERAMILITWNVQWCRGVDGRVDPERIVREATCLADFDVLCVQEIADNFPAPLLKGNTDDNQFDRLAVLLPDYTAVAGVAVDHPGEGGRRRRFGNMILSRLPVLQTFRHLLPYPVSADAKSMPRTAVEAVVRTRFGELRVINTHLEYYSYSQRGSQVEALRSLYAEGYGHARCGLITDASSGPFHSFLRPAETVICGDFNMISDDSLLARMAEPFYGGTPALFDAWCVLHPGRPHAATFNIYDTEQSGEPESDRDFVFVNELLRAHLRAIRIDRETKASDHQPIIVTFE